MGKHNGKSRSQGGTKVGGALTRRHKGFPAGGSHQGRHTTEDGPGMQSILERNDLDELMAMADLADRDFTAERYQPVVVGSTAHSALSAEQTAAERALAEERAAHKLIIPRRPPWDETTTPDQLDAQEKASFLSWRRQLAELEEEEGLLLTPFERNLEVWRQLWRVLERSDIVVQVVDARDPVTYFSHDLVQYALELHPTKRSFVLLNKADLLPAAVREAWADYFDARGVQYGFWSAFAASEAQARARHDASAQGLAGYTTEDVNAHFWELLGLSKQQQVADSGSRTRILPVEELLEVLEVMARQAVNDAEDDDSRRHDPSRRLMVGLVGYPNVGKSSTINAIFGAKKTAVAPTPGKTKHFQTLNVSPAICLCDCPGLVFPRFAASKAEMVAAGVIPIDRLTDIRAPIEVAAARCGQQQLEAVYGIQLGPRTLDAASAAADAGGSSISAAAGADGSSGAVKAAAQQQAQELSMGTRLLVALARARGWAASGGLPDEVRAGRQILKDYTNGKLLFCKLPPGGQQRGFAPAVAPLPGTVNAMQLQQPARQQHAQAASTASQQVQQDASSPAQQPHPQQQTAASSGSAGGSSSSSPGLGAPAADGSAADSTAAAAADEDGDTPDPSTLLLSEADLELMEGLGVGPKSKSKRPEHKFHKKAARSKGTRGLQADAGGYDGAALSTGKKGGLVRVGGY